MATTKGDRHKPSRMVRIPEPLAKALESIAAEEFNSLAEQVKTACREYLERKGRLPKPGNPRPKSSG
jgi:hypothetical protein